MTIAFKKNNPHENVFNFSLGIKLELKNITDTDRIEHKLNTVLIVLMDKWFSIIHSS